MRRAVITGLGIVSCLGNNRKSVTNSLRNGISGLQFRQDFADMGLICHVGRNLNLDTNCLEGINKLPNRFNFSYFQRY